MFHPGLDADYARRGTNFHSASWTTRSVFDSHWSAAGWQEAPANVRPVPGWEPAHAAWVRDLLDRTDLEHVPLRAQCPKGQRFRLKPEAVLAEVRAATRDRHRYVSVVSVLP